uniref:Uncharacterized protein n=1 Tax=Brassica oleracea TaxID=3712 RepID=A0A3P6FSS8_BRAOL|nr:unnamed protein product [Brassica oleracea]
MVKAAKSRNIPPWRHAWPQKMSSPLICQKRSSC